MPPDRPNQPHDGLIRTALDSLDNARTALAAALPRELLAHLDLARLRRVPARIVDSLLSARESDAVWEVPFAHVDQTLLAHLVAEVQSTPDVDLVLRTLGLQVRFWEQQRRLGQRLSPVIPLVISHGATWRAPRTMLERLGMPPELPHPPPALHLPHRQRRHPRRPRLAPHQPRPEDGDPNGNPRRTTHRTWHPEGPR